MNKKFYFFFAFILCFFQFPLLVPQVQSQVDMEAPLLTIGSPSDGQHVTSPTIAIQGTATDSARGNSGILQVTVNGVRANNDTAAGSGIANWNKTVTLTEGENLLTVAAYDNSPSHNVTYKDLTLYYNAENKLRVGCSNCVKGTILNITPNDIEGAGNGSAPLSRKYSRDTAVTLTAPENSGGNPFSNWLGCDSISGDTGNICNVTLAQDRTVFAYYASTISPGGFHTMAIIPGEVYVKELDKFIGAWGWGWNEYGQLGDCSNTDKNVPVLITPDENWFSVFAGGRNTFVLKKDGTLWGWGANDKGQIGDGTNIPKNCPMQIGGPYSDFVYISPGESYSLGIKSDGTLWGWGENSCGQLGNGANLDKNYPVQIGMDNDWIFMAAGDRHSLGLKSDGTIWAWGCNDFGQLGDGTTSGRYYPLQTGGENNWVSVAAGGGSSIAMKADRTLWGWGFNEAGELGDGTKINKLDPVKIGSDNDWISISKGFHHSLALKSGGTMWAWGENLYGQIGDGTNDDKNVPTQIGVDWALALTGGYHNMALKPNGALWAWGRNEYGQLGDGTNTDKSIPIKTGLPSISLISPKEGETYVVGDIMWISWDYTGNPGPDVNIELLKNGAPILTVSWPIISSGAANIRIPETEEGNFYQIRIGNQYCSDTSGFFTIKPISITVTSPNPGETYTAGKTLTVRWSYLGDPGPYVKIELLKGGALSLTIAGMYVKGGAGNGSCPWTIPLAQTVGSDYQVRVTSTGNSAYTSTSGAFTIVGPPPPEITAVTSPKAGDSFAAGAALPIGWTYNGNPGYYVKIELLKNGVVNRTIKSGNPIGTGGNGAYPNWTIPSTQATGSDYQVRVTSTTNSAYTNTSGTFTIIGPPPPEITAVTSPKAGDSYAAGATLPISWTYNGNPGYYVRIELLKNGILDSTIKTSTPIASLYNWTIPSTQIGGSDYQVRVTSTTNSAYTKTSGTFTIVGPPPPAITAVTSPKAGDSFAAGAVLTVTWTYIGNPGYYVTIELLKNGVLDRTIKTSASIGSSYNWTIPSTQFGGSDYQIKVTSTTNSAYTSTSSTFTIVGPPPPAITAVTSPKAGDSFAAGALLPISWTYNGQPGYYVRIELLKNGVLIRTIKTSTSIGSGGNGSYSQWTIPSTQASGSDYQIRVTSTLNSAYTITSDTFTVQ